MAEPVPLRRDRATPADELASGHDALWRSWWELTTIRAVALAVALGLLFSVWFLARPLALLLAAVVIAVALAPIVDLLARRLSRAVAVILVYVVLIAFAVGLGWLVIPTIVNQGAQAVQQTPELAGQVSAWLDSFTIPMSSRVQEALQQFAASSTSYLVSLPLAIISSTLEIVFVLGMSAYWLISMPAMHRFTLSLFPERQRSRVAHVLHEMGRSVGGFPRATLINGAIIGVTTFVGLTIIGLQFALVLAIIAGIGEMVPIVGPILSAVPAVLIALMNSPTQALIVLGFFIALQQFESYLLQPNVTQSQANIPPLLTMIALFAGATVGNILGAMIAIPLAGALRVLVVEVIAPAIRDWSHVDAPPALDHSEDVRGGHG